MSKERVICIRKIRTVFEYYPSEMTWSGMGNEKIYYYLTLSFSLFVYSYSLTCIHDGGYETDNKIHTHMPTSPLSPPFSFSPILYLNSPA